MSDVVYSFLRLSLNNVHADLLRLLKIPLYLGIFFFVLFINSVVHSVKGGKWSYLKIRRAAEYF